MEKLKDSSYNSGIMTSFKGLLLFSLSVLSDSLWPHGLQHSRLPCSWPFPRACANSCPLSWRCHPTTSFSVIQSPPAFNLSQHQGLFQWISCFASGGQSIRASASVSVLPINIQSWFPLGLTGLIFLLSNGLSRVFSSTTFWKHQFFGDQSSLWSNPHIHTGLYIWLQ